MSKLDPARFGLDASSTRARNTAWSARRSFQEHDISGGAFDLQHGALGGQVVVEIRDEILASRLARRVVPAVLPLMGIVLDVVELALGAFVDDGAHRADAAAEQSGRREELFQTVRLAR